MASRSTEAMVDEPKSSDAQIVPKGSCRYPSVGSSNVRLLG
jgi:hypothetical protein